MGSGGARRFASQGVALFANHDVATIPLELRGQPDLKLWQLVKPRMSSAGSDTTLGIDQLLLPIMSYEHGWEFKPADPTRQYVTSILAATRSATE